MDILTTTIRKACCNDFLFIYSTWKRSYADSRRRFRQIKNSIFDIIQKRIDRLRGSKEAKFLVAVDPDEESLIMGWICYEGPMLHYIYVKTIYRKQGVALQLLNEAGLGGATKIYCTHWNKTARIVREKKPCLVNSELAQGVIDV